VKKIRWVGRCLRRGAGLVVPIVLSVCLGATATGAVAFDAVPRMVSAQGTVQAAFAPWDDVEALVVNVIADAQSQVLMQAYLLTSRKIATALIKAQQRGIDVRVLADDVQSRVASGKIGMIAAAGVPVWLETRYQSAHNKVIVVDADTANPAVVTGSFNFTWTAQHKNAENILIVRKNPQLAALYALNWQRHFTDATAYGSATASHTGSGPETVQALGGVRAQE
jgi:phosphatidylserine/phosphatidylglycerophosphate/cardiolipin synthase-like enzyme